MGRLTVAVDQDHLERLVRRPIAGLSELIWNALDADATEIECTVEENLLGGVEVLHVRDNGLGMNLQRVDADFGQLGGSWKKTTALSETGRQLHGRTGQGRFSAFAIGATVRWTSVADDVTGARQEIAVTGRRSSLREFDVSDPVDASGRPTGTEVECTNLTEDAQGLFVRDDVAEQLAAIFAFVIEKYQINIRWRGQRVNPADLQSQRATLPVAVDDIPGVEIDIIEWLKPMKRALILCDESGIALHEMAPGIQAPGFEFTAYLRWNGFRDSLSQLVLEEMSDEGFARVISAGKAVLREYFKERSAERGSELISAWKDDLTYPYQDEPASSVERSERDLFNIVAVAAAPVVEGSDLRSRKLSLRLLREAIEKSPGTIHQVLQEVLNLPPDRLDELRLLIESTSLSAIIAAARKVTDRLDFLQGLEQMVFDRELKKHVLERSQLHRMLANETWVFREEYALTADDVTLRTALKAHTRLLGREDLEPADLDHEVLDADGRRVVVDMMLSRVIEHAHNERENIVIELKRPTVHIGSDELQQILNYATTVKADPRFAGTDTRWDFWIVGDAITDAVAMQANQANREPGIVTISPDGKFVVRAVTWGKIIQDARHRMSFVRTALEYSTTNDRGLEYLRRAHGRFLPKVAMEIDAPDLDNDAVAAVATTASVVTEADPGSST
ncbi:ATP-binding protein [Kribbella sp. NPDC048928]|uniref:ATP-binding protein n=1 Tax=Kribbella sp. NPDC048928 TaxID=3364111 RepID=UPI0037243230